MMMLTKTGLVTMAMLAVYTLTVEGGQRIWPGVSKGQIGPRAVVAGGGNGVYCTPPWENGIGVHDIGLIPPGMNVTVTVEGFTDGFNPVAAVLVASIGRPAANTIKTTTFYDDDSGGDGDPRIEFVTPQAGTYLLMVNDLTDENVGCYRYQFVVR